ncbi:MAG: FliH/SctL family protein [Fidelibacterota bacterium]
MRELRLPLSKKVSSFNIVTNGDQVRPSFDTGDLYGNTSDRVEELSKQVETLRNTMAEARDQAFQAGYSEGRQAALKDLTGQMEEIKAIYDSMLSSLKAQVDDRLEQAAKPMIRLSVKIAEKIIGAELDKNGNKEKILVNRIRELVEKVTHSKSLTVYVNPKQLNWVCTSTELESIIFPPHAEVNFVSSDRLAPGECLIELDDYFLEGDLGSQLNHIEEQLLSDLA